MAISNSIFEAFRTQERVEEQIKAINLLVKQGYTILDLEGGIINKNTIDLDQDSYHNKRPRYDYKRIVEKNTK
ncbi:MAG: hypothetical protein Unbinned306contig1002_17 [Prokaryotic dsDNA virus sp.]|nr:MAG: hypothetical protein Unbinned306contig1002_17 [Prokaryotic dsDNA virus sp.]|tara:strand:- start:20918 stop:21136 length:219 start_codon:yes stop_codon:yes gene_type:complete